MFTIFLKPWIGFNLISPWCNQGYQIMCASTPKGVEHSGSTDTGKRFLISINIDFIGDVSFAIFSSCLMDFICHTQVHLIVQPCSGLLQATVAATGFAGGYPNLIPSGYIERTRCIRRTEIEWMTLLMFQRNILWVETYSMLCEECMCAINFNWNKVCWKMQS